MNSPEYPLFQLLYPYSKHQEEAGGVNFNAFHIISVQMELECHLVCC